MVDIRRAARAVDGRHLAPEAVLAFTFARRRHPSAAQALAKEIMGHEAGHVAFMQNKVASLGAPVPVRPAVRADP